MGPGVEMFNVVKPLAHLNHAKLRLNAASNTPGLASSTVSALVSASLGQRPMD
jgi:hypothetical protein